MAEKDEQSADISEEITPAEENEREEKEEECCAP